MFQRSKDAKHAMCRGSLILQDFQRTRNSRAVLGRVSSGFDDHDLKYSLSSYVISLLQYFDLAIEAKSLKKKAKKHVVFFFCLRASFLSQLSGPQDVELVWLAEDPFGMT